MFSFLIFQILILRHFSYLSLSSRLKTLEERGRSFTFENFPDLASIDHICLDLRNLIYLLSHLKVSQTLHRSIIALSWKFSSSLSLSLSCFGREFIIIIITCETYRKSVILKKQKSKLILFDKQSPLRMNVIIIIRVLNN